MIVKLKLRKFVTKTDLATIRIAQIEDRLVFAIHVYPNDSREKFTSIINSFQVALDPDGVFLIEVPQGWTLEEFYKVNDTAVAGVLEMLATIQNIEDFKDVNILSHKVKTPVYETLKVLQDNYLKQVEV